MRVPGDLPEETVGIGEVARIAAPEHFLAGLYQGRARCDGLLHGAVAVRHEAVQADVERAEKESPFGGTIAHGYLTMSLVSHFLGQCAVGPEDAMMAINYGSDKVRFLQPVKVNSQVRGQATLLEVSDKAPGQLLTKTRMSIEIKGEETPAMVAEILTLFILS